MAQTPLRVLLVGCGGITDAHLPAFETFFEQLSLIGATDPSEAARKGVAERMKPHGQVRTFAGLEEALVQLKGGIDAALVVTPHFLHFPQAKACLEAGIAVLVEKPVCNNLTELRTLRKLSKGHDKWVVAGQNRRFDPGIQWLHRWRKENPEQFGELRSFDVHGWQNIFAWMATKPDVSADFWILDKERAGGGVVVSLLVHYLDAIRYLSGQDFVEVSARARFDPPFKNGAESACSALLKMSGGACGTLHGNYLAPKVPNPNEAVHLFGEHGYIGNPSGWQYASTKGEDADGWDFQFSGIKSVPAEAARALVPSSHSFTNQLLDFARAVRTGKPPVNTLAENFNTMAVIEAIYESMNSGGKSVAVPTN